MRIFNTFSRDPPPAQPSNGFAPQQTGVMRRVPGGRWAFMFTCIVGTIWGVVMGIAALQDRGDIGSSSRMRMAGLVLAILYLVVAGIEFLGVLISFMASPKIARVFVILAPIALAVAVGSQIVRFVIHFTLKSDIIQQCITEEMSSTWVNREGKIVDITEPVARDDCNSSWNRTTWILVAWILVVLIIGGMFWFSARAYYRKVSDPNFGRVHNVQQSFGLQGMSAPPPPPASSGYQGWEVPPYPGPPQSGPSPPASGYEKSDYQPDAEWARSEYGGPPTGSPPRADTSRPAAGFVVPNDEEEEAWRRAREEGVTAHLTGSGVPAGLREDREARQVREAEGRV